MLNQCHSIIQCVLLVNHLQMPQSHLHIKARTISATKDNHFFKIEENVDISWQLQGLRG